MKFLDNRRQKKAEAYTQRIVERLNKLEENESFTSKGTKIYFDNNTRNIDIRALFDEKVYEGTVALNFKGWVQAWKDNESEQLSLYPIK